MKTELEKSQGLLLQKRHRNVTRVTKKYFGGVFVSGSVHVCRYGFVADNQLDPKALMIFVITPVDEAPRKRDNYYLT